MENLTAYCTKDAGILNFSYLITLSFFYLLNIEFVSVRNPTAYRISSTTFQFLVGCTFKLINLMSFYFLLTTNFIAPKIPWMMTLMFLKSVFICLIQYCILQILGNCIVLCFLWKGIIPTFVVNVTWEIKALEVLQHTCWFGCGHLHWDIFFP